MNPKEINEVYFGDVNQSFNRSRRDFIKTLGGGLIIVFTLGYFKASGEDEETRNDKTDLNA